VTDTSTRVAYELADRVARYRTALVALLAYLKRHNSEYRSQPDQQLIEQCERVLDEDG